MGLQFGGHAPQVAAAPPVNGGNCAMQRYDTPQKGFAWRKTPTATNLKYAAPPPRPAQGAWRENTRPARSLRRLFREKTRPARPLRRLFREKTRPACIKTPNLGQFERTGRTFSRFHDDTAPQGELFRACRRRPSSALPISDQAPQVWRAWEGLAAVPVGGRARPDNEPTRRATHQRPRHHWCGGRRRDRRARAGFEARRRTK